MLRFTEETEIEDLNGGDYIKCVKNTPFKDYNLFIERGFD